MEMLQSIFKNHLQRSAGANSVLYGHLESKRLQKPFENGLRVRETALPQIHQYVL